MKRVGIVGGITGTVNLATQIFGIVFVAIYFLLDIRTLKASLWGSSSNGTISVAMWVGSGVAVIMAPPPFRVWSHLTYKPSSTDCREYSPIFIPALCSVSMVSF